MIDITVKQKNIITSLIHRFLPETTVWAFGSRVKFTSRPESDLDLVAFIKPEQKSNLSALKEAFEESDLPFRVDIHDWNNLPESFRKNIETQFVVLQEAGKNGEVPEGWKRYRLEDAVERLIDYRGKTPKKTERGIPLVTAKVIKNGRINTPSEFIAEDQYDEWMTRGIPEFGDVVLTTEAPLGEIAQIDTKEKIALAQRVITLRGKTNLIDNTFLKYFLLSPIGQGNLKAKETGSTATGIKQSELREVEILAPDYKSQKEIASILTSLDDKIELNLQMNQTLETIAQAIFKQWFVDFNFPARLAPERPQPPNGGEDIRMGAGESIPLKSSVEEAITTISLDEYSASRETAQDTALGGFAASPSGDKVAAVVGYKDSGGEMVDGLPKGWQRVAIGSIAKSIQYGFTQSSSKVEIGPKFLRITDIQNGNVDWSLVPYCEITAKERERYKIREHDIFVARTGASTGENIYITEPPGAVFASYLIRIQFNQPEVAFYIGKFMRRQEYFNYIASSLGGSAQPNANAQTLTNIKIIVPDHNLINKYYEIVFPLQSRIVKNQNENQTLTSIRDALLPRLMSGKICLNTITGLQDGQD